jgi:hypothetical protein
VVRSVGGDFEIGLIVLNALCVNVGTSRDRNIEGSLFLHCRINR